MAVEMFRAASGRRLEVLPLTLNKLYLFAAHVAIPSFP